MEKDICKEKEERHRETYRQRERKRQTWRVTQRERNRWRKRHKKGHIQKDREDIEKDKERESVKVKEEVPILNRFDL